MTSGDFSIGKASDGETVVTTVHVHEGRIVEEPVRVLIDDDRSRVMIRCARGSKATIEIDLQADGKAIAHDIEAHLDDESSCTILCFNEASSASDVVVRQRSTVEKGAVVRWQNVTLGGKTVTHDLISHVKGADGESAVDWMFYAKGSEKQTLTVRNIFDGRNGAGEILMRGIAEEKGHAVCKGLIDIGLHGGGTNTYLTQEVLMLDASSKVDAVPGLEIKTNDVKASHSATVARVTEEDLFYFGARGIDASEARRMFTLGFLGDVTGRIASVASRERIIGAIERKYGAGGQLA